ncbi:MAG: beta-ketoacyl-[acyl-carrier-protein] synthase family protein [Gemmataceae bacterium]|nr:beta-ketoacyl-[acyl-carrier-protein] synthase family protein [Gemmataceae bacterium]MDW8263905.1 beta-ketoacyl-[acyl-carrier-protein] synthase family protein [Gemmataceae bacterium]
MKRRVVITGMGAITPLGHSPVELYEAQIEGRSGVGPITLFNASTFPTRIAAEVKGFDLNRFVRGTERWIHAGANSRFAAAAAAQALADAELLDNDRIDRTRFGVYFGTGEGTQDFPHLVTVLLHCYDEQQRVVDNVAFAKGGLEQFTPELEFEQELHTATAHLAAHFGLEGPNYNCLTACAASSQAIGEATELIRHGTADLMLTGGSHSMIHPLGVTGFNLLTALSTRNDEPEKASRPFDLHRDGFVLGEGAGVLVLEELEHARRRKAPIYAEVTGYGSTADAFRVTDSHPEGRGAIACIQAALKDSGLPPEAIGYINAHGTSTEVNDKVETLAIKRVFGERAYQIPVSSSKSMLGHLIAAAGAVELITTVLALRRGVLPPTINYETPDPECDLDYIPNVARECRVRHALSNSFGFGGQNISLIVSRYDD